MITKFGEVKMSAIDSGLVYIDINPLIRIQKESQCRGNEIVYSIQRIDGTQGVWLKPETAQSIVKSLQKLLSDKHLEKRPKGIARKIKMIPRF